MDGDMTWFGDVVSETECNTGLSGTVMPLSFLHSPVNRPLLAEICRAQPAGVGHQRTLTSD